MKNDYRKKLYDITVFIFSCSIKFYRRSNRGKMPRGAPDGQVSGMSLYKSVVKSAGSFSKLSVS